MDELERQRELFERAMDDMSRNVIATADTFDDLNKSVNKYSKGLDKLDEFTNTYGRQIKNLGRDFDQNKGKMSAFSGITDLAGDALGELGVAGRLAGKALSAIAGITFEEVDRTIENFQRIGSVGAVGAGGMTEFRVSAHAATLTMDQFANIISKNAGALALATGNTLDGARALSQVTQAAGETGLRRQLMNLGVGIEEQSDFFAEYFAQIRRLGLQQNRDYRSQSGAVGTYVKQLILLSRITGESIDSAKATMEAQQRSARFSGAMQELAATQGAEYANRVGVEVAAIANKLGPAGDGLRDAFAGFNTQAAKEFLVTFGDEGRAAIDLVKSGAADLGDLSEMLVRAGERQRERFGGPGQLALLAETGVIDATAQSLLNIPRAAELTREALQKQVDAINAGAAGADEMTKRLNEAAESSQKTAVNLESARDIFINLGSTVLPAFSGAVETATGLLEDMVQGIGGGLKGKERASGGPVSSGQSYLVGEEGPEIFSPGASGQITNADITAEVMDKKQANADITAKVMDKEQVISLYEFLMKQGGVPSIEGFSQMFLPGVGRLSRQMMAGGQIDRLEGFGGEEILKAVKYGAMGTVLNKITAGGEDYMRGFQSRAIDEGRPLGDERFITAGTGFAQMSGPGGYYDKMMADVSPFAGQELQISDQATGTRTQYNNPEFMMEFQKEMYNVLSQIAQNTRSGTDATKQILRATTG